MKNLYNLWKPCFHTTLKNEAIISETISLMDPDYAYIKISDNNDYLIGKYLKSSARVILELGNILEFSTFLNFHRNAIHQDPWAIIIPTKFLDSEFKEHINSLIQSPYSNNFGLLNPSLKDLEIWKESFGSYPDLISVSVCPPRSFPKDVIDFCITNRIPIISVDISDGSNVFSLDYLYRLASKYTNLVVTEINSIEDSYTWPTLLNTIHGQEIEETTNKVLTLDRNIDYRDRFTKIDNNLTKIKKYIDIMGNTWALQNPVYELSNIRYSLEDIESIDLSKKLNETENYVLSNTSESLESDVIDLGEQQYVIRNTVEGLLRIHFKKLKFLEIDTLPVSDNLVIITVTSKFLKLFDTSRSFILDISEGPRVIFKEIPQKEISKVSNSNK